MSADRGPSEGRRALVVGLGAFGGGAGAARHLVRRGFEVTVTDLRPEAELSEGIAALAGFPVRAVLGGHRAEDFERADLVVANPAVPPSSPWLARARAAGARVTSEIELFLDASPARILAVTGTQGKSSTVHMAASLLAAAGLPARAGGNLGGSLLDELDRLGPDDVVVLELSSYQLEALAPPRPGERRRALAVAVVNVLADHLERHGSVAAYAAAKRRILELLDGGDAEGVALLPALDPRLAAWRPRRGRRVDVWPEGAAGPGLAIEDGAFRLDGEALGRVFDLALPGSFQRANALVALGLARIAGAEPARLAAALPGLSGLPHRVEELAPVRGRRVVDNGVSTTPDSTVSALRSLGRVGALLCGGRAKRLPLDELAREAAARAALTVCFGESRDELAAALAAAGADTRSARTVEEAAALALADSSPGDVLLFSPACASFDAYRNFRDRALAFRAALEALRTASAVPGGRALPGSAPKRRES